MPFRVETGAQCQSYLFWIFGDVWLIEVMYIWRCVGIYICVMSVHVYCIQVNYFKTVVPFRHPRYSTSHCYSELSGDYWDKLSHPTITDIFAGIHAQTQAAGKGN